MPSATELSIFAVSAEQVVPAHSRLAGDTRSHNANVGAGNVVIFVCSDDVAVEILRLGPACDRSSALPWGKSLNHIEHDHITESFEQRQMRHRPADITRAN